MIRVMGPTSDWYHYLISQDFFVRADILANARALKVGSMWGQCRRRWANIEPTLNERLVFSEMKKDTYPDNGRTLVQR